MNTNDPKPTDTNPNQPARGGFIKRTGPAAFVPSLAVGTFRNEAQAASGASSCCVVTSFEVPKGLVRCDKNWYRGLGKWKVFSSWSVEVIFGGDCSCCEFRQYIRGYMKRRFPGGPWGTDIVELANGKTLDPEIWYEDGDPEPFGHRDGTNTDNDKYTPKPRATGCKYEGSDEPGMYLLPGQDYEMKLEFRWEIIETCDHCPKDKPKKTKELNPPIFCKGNVGPALGP